MLNQDFIKNIERLLPDEYEAFATALELAPPVSIRINPRKPPPSPFEAVSADQSADRQDRQGGRGMSGMSRIKVPWCQTGYYLPERPSFTADPLFHAGAYYVQEASSMFLEQAVTKILSQPDFPKEGIRTLDLCAAPGGKSTHLLTLLPDDSLLVCNEVIRNRCSILTENITKWGYPNVLITQNDPKEWGQIRHFFDIIVTDLPCSGEGLFRKDSTASAQWSLELAKHSASRQRRIIRDIWDTLKPGGYLIYSTCTFNTEENEENIKTLSDELKAEIIPIPVDPTWNVSGTLRFELPVYRFFPHRTRGEGFFLALLRKRNSNHATTSNEARSDHRKNKPSPALPASLKNILINPEKFFYRNFDSIFAIPIAFESAITALSRRLHIISPGLFIGQLKSNDFIPSAALSLSTELNIRAFPAIELTSELALSYLKKETITLPEDAPKGYLLVTFQHLPLGFIKNIGNRANNLYPTAWRIRNMKGC